MKLLETYRKLDHTCCLNSSTMKYGIITDDETDRDCKDIEEMTDCLDDLEKVVKAFEIIINKPCDLDWVIDTIKSGSDYETYLYLVDYSDNKLLQKFKYTKEEFNLLKEVLK